MLDRSACASFIFPCASCRLITRTHTHTHTHTRTHTHTHTHTDFHTHTHTHTHTHMYKHTHLTDTHINTRKHTRAHTYSSGTFYISIYISIYICIYIYYTYICRIHIMYILNARCLWQWLGKCSICARPVCCQTSKKCEGVFVRVLAWVCLFMCMPIFYAYCRVPVRGGSEQGSG